MGIWKGQTPWLQSIHMNLTNKKESINKILRAIDAMVVFHSIMLDFNASDLPVDIDLDNISTITYIDDADLMSHPYEQLILDVGLNDDDAPGTRN